MAQKVKIIDACMVAPSPASSPADSPTPKSLPLTFFDIRWIRLPPVQRLFFYEISIPNSNPTAFFHSHILPSLKQSLSLTLTHFLPLSGSLTWPESSHQPVLNYAEGDTVSLTMAESDADFPRLSGTTDHLHETFEATQYHALVPNLAVSCERASVLALQVTLFPNYCGFSIGVSFHHAVLDGKTTHTFLKSWAHMCRSLGRQVSSLPPELKPFFDRTVIKDPTGIEEIYTKHLLDGHDEPNNRSLMSWKLYEVPSDSVRGTFQLTRANIGKLREQANTNIIKQQLHVSTFSLVCAYTWVCLVKAEQVTDEEIVLLGFNFDCRSRLEPPIPATYFGNCLGRKRAAATAKSLLGDHGFTVAVQVIGEAIKSLENDKKKNDHGVLNGAEDWASSVPVTGRLYSVAGSTRFEVYNTDFGWGRPKKVDVVSIDRTRAFSLSECRDGNGVEIGLVLRKWQMEAFASLFAQGLE